jgi:hypothetical protein
MRIIGILLFFIGTFYACDRLPKPPKKEDLLNRELQSINWQEVDQYPSVPYCDTITNKQDRSRCFFQYISATLQQKLDADTLSGVYAHLDSVKVTVTIFPDSSIEFEPHFKGLLNTTDSTKIDSVLKAKAVEFPKINPATKRGVPVKCKFDLPVIFKKSV